MMEKITFGQVWLQDRSGMFNWLVGEAVALVLGAWVVRMLAWGNIEIAVLVFYGAATAASIFAGYEIASRVAPRIMARRDMVKLLNDRVHKWVVVALNGMVFAALCVRTYLEARALKPYPLALLTILCLAAGAYLWSSHPQVVQPHSVMARFRSAMLRALMMSVLAGLVLRPLGLLVAIVIATGLLVPTWHHLKRESKRWGWDIR